MSKKVVISAGPIPARLDPVKFITNRFKGGLAFKTATYLIDEEYDLTVVVWQYTSVPENIEDKATKIVRVQDVFDYYNWFKKHATEYDAFIMAAAVANLTPSNPWDTKFPSHNYKVGEKFDITFEIAPRAIDVIKKINPRCCLIGYKLLDAMLGELIEAGTKTLAEARANIIFANHPSTAKEKKFAIMADNTVYECSFEEHLDLIKQAIEAEYFRTETIPMSEEIASLPSVKHALSIVKMYEKTFSNGYGTVAIPVEIDGYPKAFVTTSRGHRGDPVIVYDVDMENKIIKASSKATLNAPTLSAVLEDHKDRVVVHRHFEDPLYNLDGEYEHVFANYLFPGTKEEAFAVKEKLGERFGRIKFSGHGDISVLPIGEVSWNTYYEDFPERYFNTCDAMQEIIDAYASKETIEIGGNKNVCSKYAYDPYVPAENAENILLDEIKAKPGGFFDLTIIRNAIQYIDDKDLDLYLSKTKAFIANTFYVPPEEKVTEREAAVLVEEDGFSWILHALRMPDDSIVVHRFHARGEDDWEAFGLDVQPYGKNSALISKGLDDAL